MGDRIGHAELGRFDRKVLELGPVGVKAIEVAAIENAKRDQRSQPLTVRRQFMDADAPEIDRERRNPFRLVLSEVASVIAPPSPATATQSPPQRRRGRGRALRWRR